MTISAAKIAVPRHGFRLDTGDEALAAYMQQVNGRAERYSFRDIDIWQLGDDLEKQLDDACIPRCHRPGVTAVVRSAGPDKSKNTRRWSARGEGTEAHFRRYADGWRLMHAKRLPVFGGETQRCTISINRHDYEAIQMRAVAQFAIASPAR